MWRGFLERLTPNEMVALEGSVPAFLVRTAEFLRQTPYADAFNDAESRAREALKSIPISVIMPFYNRVAWTLEAVKSVLGQTHANLELLLVDDGSRDDLEPLRQAIRDEPRVRYVRQENAGPARARNYGLRLAAGEYVAFLDSDDRFHAEKLERQLWFMVARGLDLSHTSYQCMDADDRPLEVRHAGRFSGNVFPEIIESCPIAPSTFMGLTEVLRENPFPEAFQIGEDVCWLIRLAMTHPIGGLDEPLTDFRLGPETAADNYHKQVIGLTNILSFVGGDGELVQCRQQIGGLLMRLGELFDVQDLSMQCYQDMRGEFEELQRHHLELQRKYESLLDAVTHSRVLNFAKWLRGLLPHSPRS
jgi:hypothetical protein